MTRAFMQRFVLCRSGGERMSTIEVGPLTVHTNSVGWQPALTTAFNGSLSEGLSYSAVVTGPSGLEIDLAVFMGSNGEGMVHCPDSAGVPPEYVRLSHGARLGIYAEAATIWIIKQLRLLHHSPESGWGNPRLATLAELDMILGSSVEDLLRPLGLREIGIKQIILGKGGNDLVLRWDSAVGPELPLAAYTCTRILPIFRNLHS